MDERYPPYPQYKPSGVDWLGEIPAHWEVRRLKFVADINPSKAEVAHLSDDLEASFLPMECVGNGTVYIASQKPLKEIKRGFTYFRDGDVIVAKITPSFENGKGALVSGLTNGIGFGTTELHVIRASQALDKLFLYYLTLSHQFRGMGETQMYGTAGQKRIPDQFINDFPALLPPLSEQRAIAGYLDRETARIDALIAHKRDLLALLERRRAALISHAVTQGLNPDAPRKPSGIAWLGEIPEHWEVRRLKSAIAFSINGAWGDEPKGNGDDLICIRVTDFDYENLGVSSDNLTVRNIPASMQAGRLLDKGDLLIEKSGGGDIWPVGRVVNYTLNEKAVSSNFIARMVVNRSVDKRFMSYLFATLYEFGLNARSIKQTTGLQNLDLYSYLNERFGLPPLPEQRAIAEYLDRETARLDRLKAEIESSIELLRRYRVALISAAVTGKIDVRGM